MQTSLLIYLHLIVANKNILSHVESLNEEEKKEFYSLISKNQEELNKDFTVLKEDVIGQLKNLELNSDVETKQKISETIQKVNDEKLSLTNFLKLKKLKERFLIKMINDIDILQIDEIIKNDLLKDNNNLDLYYKNT